MEDDVIDELCAYLLEHARRENLILASPLHVTFHTDEGLALGEFGIQARLVRPEDPDPGPASGAADAHGETMIYSTSSRVREPLAEAPGRRRAPRALLLVRGRRLLVPPSGATIGRSRECEIVLEDSGISRRHAEIRPSPAGNGWTVADLGSTNGVLLNGRVVGAAEGLAPGDRIELGLDGDRLRTRMTTLAPVSVALKFGFLAVLYLFLLWVARSARRDLRAAPRGRPRRAARSPRRDRLAFGLRARRRAVAARAAAGRRARARARRRG